ncbi:hypothetical protein LA374_16645 [Aeromonas schubertii]|uniref:Motility protein n=1 Tax=Aeromonas schubertii TaxID=652 RepID=A0ABS7VEL3_9GAMM|nr:hypothetical protein [Aeromonas schubertii]MBZ6067823.1 hypothetical protein [Aeromonas schubertii]
MEISGTSAVSDSKIAIGGKTRQEQEGQVMLSLLQTAAASAPKPVSGTLGGHIDIHV